MSSIIPVDLLSFATNPSYLNTLVATNNTPIPAINLLAYDPSFASIIGENATARQLYDLNWQAFHEAGVYNKATNKIYITSNWAGDFNNPINTTIIDLSNNYALSSTRYPGIAEPNGATSYYPPGTQTTTSTPPHILFADSADFNTYSALVSLDPTTNQTTPILTSFLGRNFSSLNDVRQHPTTGDLWFTDADYGFFQSFRPAPTIPKQVYRFSPLTGEIAVVATDFNQCNGLEFSPDLKTLYVSDTGAVGFGINTTMPATVYAFDISEDGKRVGGRRVFAYTDSGFPDGVHTDTEGNVWAGCGDGVHVWSPEGKLLGKIWIGVESNNFAFLPGAVLVFSNRQLWAVENLKAVGREVKRDFGV
ncbi:lactonohydrolase [Plenodomus tracheiphilus IPT5]|uniref:Lactonohydrolase n=1 Tax=Plenodomus tracheiphilus IPT5 TaxID=1408161 RepID=A0A6A7BCR8_9PLEO|nr:lactonohydrolase [Plenodomus tracheiphilus IPT5]